MIIRTKSGVQEKRRPCRFSCLKFLLCKNFITLDTAASMPPKAEEGLC